MAGSLAGSKDVAVIFSKILTVFADASYLDREGIKAGGFAYWARGDGDARLQHAQEWPCDSIDEAETVGLAVGTLAAIDNLPLLPGGAMVLQSDSLRALGLFLKMGVGRPAKGSDRRILPVPGNVTATKFVQEVRKAVMPLQARIWLKHIKAHTDNEDPRYFVNNWCDREAKAARRKLYARLRKAHEELAVIVLPPIQPNQKEKR